MVSEDNRCSVFDRTTKVTCPRGAKGRVMNRENEEGQATAGQVDRVVRHECGVEVSVTRCGKLIYGIKADGDDLKTGTHFQGFEHAALLGRIADKIKRHADWVMEYGDSQDAGSIANVTTGASLLPCGTTTFHIPDEGGVIADGNAASSS
jgi:hypothetical protein